MTPQMVLDLLSDLNPDAILLDNMDAALVGVGKIGTADPVAVYSQTKILAQLHRDGFLEAEAADYFSDKIAGDVFAINVPVILQDADIREE